MDPGNADLPIGMNSKEEATQESGVPKKIHENGESEVGFGWHSRGYLPHFEGENLTQHVTFHLADSLPQHVLEKMNQQINAFPPEKQDLERRKRIEAWLDAGYGSCVLREPDVAVMVQRALLHFDASRYRLMEWAIMPNHVHVLFEPEDGWKMSEVVASWKKFTARRIRDFIRAGIINPDIDSSHRIWHREYRDRYIRNELHFQNVVDYIRMNPVKAGFAARPEEWPWSSARIRCQESRSPDQQV
ncbi:MAG: transposase [Candidatus Sumerlaeia bacterium]